MSEFDDLKAALGAATPDPDAARRAEHIALAMRNFDDLQQSSQGLAAQARLTSEPPQKGGIRGVFVMLRRGLSRQASLRIGSVLTAFGLVGVFHMVYDSFAGDPMASVPLSRGVEPVIERRGTSKNCT